MKYAPDGREKIGEQELALALNKKMLWKRK